MPQIRNANIATVLRVSDLCDLWINVDKCNSKLTGDDLDRLRVRQELYGQPVQRADGRWSRRDRLRGHRCLQSLLLLHFAQRGQEQIRGRQAAVQAQWPRVEQIWRLDVVDWRVGQPSDIFLEIRGATV